MLEKELKILEVDLPHLQSTLLQLGAVCTYDGPIHDLIFNKRSKGRGLKMRLRKTQDASYLCFKNKSKAFLRDDVKVRQEWEYEVDWQDTYDMLINDTFLQPIESRTKHRIAYQIGDVHFDIEQYESLPPFLEIEAPTSDLIHEWLQKLGYEKHTQLICGVKGLFAHYGQYKLSHYA